MPITLAEKRAIVDSVSAVATKAVAAVVVDYRGLTVNQMNQIRTQARDSGVYLRVVRNTLTKRAFANTEFKCLNDSLIGPVFIALSLEAPGDAARLLKGFIKIFDNLKIKALSVGNKVYGPEQIDAVASLPTKNEALAKLMFAMKAPIEKFVRTIAEPQAKLVRTLAAVKVQKDRQ